MPVSPHCARTVVQRKHSWPKACRAHGDDLSVILSCLACCLRKRELLAARALCRKSPLLSSVGVENIDAAVLAVQCTNLWLRRCFDLVERRLCHHASCWRLGFYKQRSGNREAAFWICRGIESATGGELPREIEMLVATFCNNPFLSWVSSDGRQLRRLNNMAFHWHRKFSSGASGPWSAARTAQTMLASSGAVIFDTAAGMRLRDERALSVQGTDITDKVYSDARLLQRATDMLSEAMVCMEAHPLKFGRPLQDAMAEDQALKSENRDEEERAERLRQLGCFADGDRDVRL